MPTLGWHDLTAWLDDGTSARCVAVAEALPSVSPDHLPRLVQADGAGQRLLELSCRTLFVWRRGYRIIADPVMAKPFAPALERLAWGDASRDHQPV